MNLQFASLTREERAALIARRDRRERTLFPKGNYVGSDACQSCHGPQHELWAASPHARAWQTLEAKGETLNPECVSCHVTGFEEQGGFPDGGDALRNVGCESCHGPGGSHVAEGAEKKGTILALADKCDSCVILQICGSCHDQEWDPEFEFELDDKLDRIRHGMLSTALLHGAPVPIHSGSALSGSANSRSADSGGANSGGAE
jgi:mono/diheme cytochrome c family protein